MVASADNPVYAILPLPFNICRRLCLYHFNICRRPAFVAYLRIVASGCLPSRCISTNT